MAPKTPVTLEEQTPPCIASYSVSADQHNDRVINIPNSPTHKHNEPYPETGRTREQKKPQLPNIEKLEGEDTDPVRA